MSADEITQLIRARDAVTAPLLGPVHKGGACLRGEMEARRTKVVSLFKITDVVITAKRDHGFRRTRRIRAAVLVYAGDGAFGHKSCAEDPATRVLLGPGERVTRVQPSKSDPYEASVIDVSPRQDDLDAMANEIPAASALLKKRVADQLARAQAGKAALERYLDHLS